MIKPLRTPQLTSAKPRCGLQSVSELLPRLIRQYEIQAELMQQHVQSNSSVMAHVGSPTAPVHQATFGWYE